MSPSDLSGRMRESRIEHVLVTGAAGKIGRVTLTLLRSHGVRVTALTKEPAALSDVEREIVGDACDEQIVADALDGIDAVVHLAALPHPTSGTPIEVFRTNVVSTFTVLAQAAERGVRRAAIASSINALGIPMNHHEILPERFPLDVGQSSFPDDAYSLSKFCDEWTARMVASRWGMPVVALRFPFVGTDEEIDRYAAAARADPRLLMREGWSYLHLEDAATVLVRALVAETTGAHTMAVAADDTCVPYATDPLLDRFAPGVPRGRRFPGRTAPIDTEPARRLLGFAPAHTLDLPIVGLPDQLIEEATVA